MAGTEPWKAPQPRVGGMTAEELNEEERQVALGRTKIVGIERAQKWVALDACIEQHHDTLEGRVSTNRFIDCHRRFPVAGKDATHNGMWQAERFSRPRTLYSTAAPQPRAANRRSA